jgi:hypothetical protein
MSKPASERDAKLKALSDERIALINQFSVTTATHEERAAVERRLQEISDEESRLFGFSETEIDELNAKTEADVEALIRSEVEIGLALFQGALRGDKTAITKLQEGSLEFAAAIGEGAIRPSDLAKLPLAAEFAAAGAKALDTRH